MGKEKGTRQIRLCRCGCGKRVKELWHDGRFRGYAKYAAGCNFRAWRKESREKLSKTLREKGHPRTRPLGSKRLSTSRKGIVYVLIKVRAQKNGWMFEHRFVAQQVLGRELLPGECVHHINGDTRDNRPENLRVMGHGEHASLAGKSNVQRGLGIFAIPVCPLCGWRHPPH